MSTLICGSLAYDNIMTFQGRFGDHILPDQVHQLNISFLVPTMRRNFGGCAGNIAYALNLLGGVASTVRTAGGELTVAEHDSVSIAVTRPLPTPRYAHPGR